MTGRNAKSLRFATFAIAWLAALGAASPAFGEERSGTGVLTIAHEDAPNKFTVVQTVKIQPSGRTMWLDLTTHRVFVPVATTTPGANGRAQTTPNTMKVLVLAPQ